MQSVKSNPTPVQSVVALSVSSRPFRTMTMHVAAVNERTTLTDSVADVLADCFVSCATATTSQP